MIRKLLFILMFLLLSGGAHAGVVVTRDGQSFSGPLRFEGQRVGVDLESGTRWFELKSIATVDLRSGGPGAAKEGHGLRGEYFVGRNLHTMMLVRNDPGIDFDWRQTVPHPALCSQGREFSVRWTGKLVPQFSEKYRIIANTDDGVRVWVDGKLIVDAWYDKSAGEVSGEVNLQAATPVDIKIEYYNGQELASAMLMWSSPSLARQVIPPTCLLLPQEPKVDDPGMIIKTPSTDGGGVFQRFIRSDRTGLRAEYYADRELTHLNFTRFDPNISAYYYSEHPPDPVMSPEGSIRWSGMLEPRFSEEYRFHIEAQRRVRLWIDGRLIIDRWGAEGGDFESTPVRLTAGKKVAIKIEYASPNNTMLCRLRWSSKSQYRDIIPPSAFSAPVDSKLARPAIGLIYPASDTMLVAPATVALLASGVSPNGAVQKVEFFDRTGVMAAIAGQPYRFAWNRPAPGVYTIKAKITDSLGVTALSESHTLTITGKGDGTLRAPWGDFFMANNEFHTAGAASMNGDAITIARAMGVLTSETDHDSGHFVVQPLENDGQIIARLTRIDPNDANPATGLFAGITIRQQLTNHCKHFALIFNWPGGEGSISLVRRQETWLQPASNDRKATLPCWLKLARHSGRVHAYTSPDGKTWELIASERFDSSPMAIVGLVAGSRDKDRPVAAQFDNVRVIPGSPPLETPGKGFVTRLGTFVAAEVYMIDDSLVRYRREGREGSIAVGDVARILYQPILADHAARLKPGSTGLLMGSGDFLEGRVRSVRDNNVTVSSANFGLRRVYLNEDIAAVILRDIQPAATPFLVATTDQTLFRVKSIHTSGKTLEIDDASLGKVQLPLGMISTIRSQ